MRLERKPFLLEILGAGVLGVTSVDCVSLHPRNFLIVAIGAYRERRAGGRTVAGVEANDEARLLLDFLRHRDGRDVVDCR